MEEQTDRLAPEAPLEVLTSNVSQTRIEEEFKLLKETLEQHAEISDRPFAVPAKERNLRTYLDTLAASTAIDEATNIPKIGNQVAAIRHNIARQLTRDFAEQVERADSLTKSYDRIRRRSDRVPELHRLRTQRRILEERVASYQRIVAMNHVLEREADGLPFDQWQPIFASAAAAVSEAEKLRFEMADGNTLYRKFIGDVRRERWARWGLILAVATAALGQADEAIVNAKEAYDWAAGVVQPVLSACFAAVVASWDWTSTNVHQLFDALYLFLKPFLGLP